VNSFLTEYEFIKNDNFILPKCCTYALLKFTRRARCWTKGDESHQGENGLYMEAEPAHYMLPDD
jgi:hypothetical protein